MISPGSPRVVWQLLCSACVDTECFLPLQVGDGTTSVTLLAAEFLKQVKPYVEEGLHPQIIIRAFRTATQLVRPCCSELGGLLSSTAPEGALWFLRSLLKVVEGLSASF